MRTAVPGVLGTHFDGRQVHVRSTCVETAGHLGAAQRRSGLVLARADHPGVLELVAGGTAARRQAQVGRHVARVGLGEGGHQLGRAVREVVGPRHQTLPVVGRVPLVVGADQAIAVGHAGVVGGEPVDRAHEPAVPFQGEQRGPGIDGRREVRAVGGRIAREGAVGAVDAGTGQLAVREAQHGRRQVRDRRVGRLGDPVRDRGERALPEAAGVAVVQLVVEVAAGAAVGVGRGEHDVGRVVSLGQPPQHLPDDAVGHQRQLAHHQERPVAARPVDEGEGAGALAGVDPGAALVRLPISEHAALGGLAGDVGDAAPGQETGGGGRVGGRRVRHRRSDLSGFMEVPRGSAPLEGRGELRDRPPTVRSRMTALPAERSVGPAPPTRTGEAHRRRADGSYG